MFSEIKTGVGVLIRCRNCILLGHRTVTAVDTGGIYEPGSWTLPGGKQEFGEKILECAFREVKEETGIEISDLRVFGVGDDIALDRQYLTVWVEVLDFLNSEEFPEVQVMEPDKQDVWKWFSLSELPDNIYSPSEKFINEYIKRNMNK